MKFPRFPHLRFAKFALIAVACLNFAGFIGYLSPALAPLVTAATQPQAIPSDIPKSGDCDLDWIIFRAGERQGVDPRLIHAVIKQESQYKSDATSQVGAQGLMQLMPATAKRFHCDDVNDRACNIEAGTKYLGWLLKRFEGNVQLALAAYNAGEGSVDKYQGIPPYDETQNYVRKIVGNYGKTYHPVLSPDDAKVAFDLDSTATSTPGE